LLLADLHLKKRLAPAYDHLLARVHCNPPDLILLAGDIVHDRTDHRRALPALRTLVGSLVCGLGIFAVLGNHDGALLPQNLSDSKLKFLDGQMLRFAENDPVVEVIGVPGPFRDNLTAKFLCSIGPKPAGAFRIVLGHYPDALPRILSLQADLFLAGHTHGGQICLPGGVPILRHDTLPRELCRGVHRIGGTCVVVSRGVGYAGIPLRLFCPAEVVEIVLKSEM
jgi:hypothetical protein